MIPISAVVKCPQPLFEKIGFLIAVYEEVRLPLSFDLRFKFFSRFFSLSDNVLDNENCYLAVMRNPSG